MIVNEILNVLGEMRDAYNTQNFDFSKWHALPLLIIEDSGGGFVEDSEIFERILETLVHCSTYLDLPILDFRVQHLMMISDTIATTILKWEFSNVQKKAGLVLEIGHIMQKKDNSWKIIALLQPTWQEPPQNRDDIKSQYINYIGGRP